MGNSVSLSSDGNIVAIGANRTNNYTGRVTIHQCNSDGSWSRMGQELNGISEDSYFGWNVSLSSNGQRVAIGAPYHNADSGHVKVYEWNDTSWNQIGQVIVSEDNPDEFGTSVSLSADGNTVAIGAPANVNLIGYVSIYQFSGLKHYDNNVIEFNTNQIITTSMILEDQKLTIGSNVEVDISGNLSLENSELTIQPEGSLTVSGDISLINSTIYNMSDSKLCGCDTTQTVEMDASSSILELGEFITQESTDNVYSVKASASGTGDPYIKSANGKTTKTPDAHGFYRLFENTDMFINVEVDKLDITETLTNFLISKNHPFEQLNGQELITDGYWNKSVYIESEGNKFAYDLFNTQTIFLENKNNYFTVQSNDNQRRRKMYDVPVNDTITQSINIEWTHSIYGKQSVILDLYENPQIQNGIKLNSKLIHEDDSIGLFVKNYKAKYMELDNLMVGKTKKLRKRLVRDELKGKSLFHETPIKEENEAWYTVENQKMIKF